MPATTLLRLAAALLACAGSAATSAAAHASANARGFLFVRGIQRPRRSDVCAPLQQTAQRLLLAMFLAVSLHGQRAAAITFQVRATQSSCTRMRHAGRSLRPHKNAQVRRSRAAHAAACAAAGVYQHLSSSTLPRCARARAQGAGCLKMTTGTGNSNDGYVTVYVDQGAGFVDMTSTPLGGDNDDDAKNLQACVGECDDDSQCAAGLKCFQRDNTDAIPGCIGAGNTDWDYCHVGKPPAPLVLCAVRGAR